jgi:hypothetical protein
MSTFLFGTSDVANMSECDSDVFSQRIPTMDDSRMPTVDDLEAFGPMNTNRSQQSVIKRLSARKLSEVSTKSGGPQSPRHTGQSRGQRRSGTSDSQCSASSVPQKSSTKETSEHTADLSPTWFAGTPAEELWGLTRRHANDAVAANSPAAVVDPQRDRRHSPRQSVDILEKVEEKDVEGSPRSREYTDQPLPQDPKKEATHPPKGNPIVIEAKAKSTEKGHSAVPLKPFNNSKLLQRRSASKSEASDSSSTVNATSKAIESSNRTIMNCLDDAALVKQRDMSAASSATSQPIYIEGRTPPTSPKLAPLKSSGESALMKRRHLRNAPSLAKQEDSRNEGSNIDGSGDSSPMCRSNSAAKLVADASLGLKGAVGSLAVAARLQSRSRSNSPEDTRDSARHLTA